MTDRKEKKPWHKHLTGIAAAFLLLASSTACLQACRTKDALPEASPKSQAEQDNTDTAPATQAPDSTPVAPATPPPPASDDNSSYIGETAAQEIALSHADLEADAIRNYKCELDLEDGIMVYEMEFDSGNYEYSYEIHAVEGTILKYERDIDD